MRIKARLDVLRKRFILLVVGSVLAVVGIVGTWLLFEMSQSCGPSGLKRLGDAGECVGVTDGGVGFGDEYEEYERVFDLIKVANDEVIDEAHERNTTYYSIAYMTSFTLTDADSNTRKAVLDELQGAYDALRRHNSERAPKIRLLIANTGSTAQHWEHTVAELAKRQRTEDRLVAVAGLGPSEEQNIAAVEKLSEERLAIVASTMTADFEPPIENFVRVAPTNADQALAAVNHLKLQGHTEMMIIRDIRGSNHYAQTLADAFEESVGEAGQDLIISYGSDNERWENEIHQVPGQVCTDAREELALLFAGRSEELVRMVQRLGAEPVCDDKSITVMTGDDLSNLTAEELTGVAAMKNIQVLYTGLAHPGAVKEVNQAVNRESLERFEPGGAYSKRFGNPTDDGRAMMGHDAVLVITHAMVAALGDSETTAELDITGEDVGRMLFHMKGGNTVKGASGCLSFDDEGNPINKSIPILTIAEEEQKGVVTVLAMSAPDGTLRETPGSRSCGG
ncbi:MULTISPECIES: hypothetical protein [Actinoalloteichus]|uniref:Receptor ligand binding region domain-containing protein n=1 Tax=Actinoalloteichus fjordicus TaxID=1612552 RepID=A0AAC9LEF4_9PSEU|nr:MULTISPECIES: hypothetical protein [Actinoalloteichus]APU15345.1 hypothetical protein UA74_16575 [Actinoalloteichus fjordicus]APU21412.1 hypothetical protein UA75_17110 [Actinoalloteichus sp. GBA129-24]